MTLTKYLKCLLVIALWFQVGCLRENTENCYSGLQLRFTYTLNNSGTNLFGPKVNGVSVYLFDQGGVLRAQANERGAVLTNDYVMELEVDPGKYTIITWACGEENLSTSYALSNSAVVGQTHLDDFCLMLRQGNGDRPHHDAFSDLFYGAAGSRTAGTSVYVLDQVEVASDQYAECTIELIKNTNTINVTVHGLEYLHHYQPQIAPDDVLHFEVAAANGDCLYNNTIGADARRFCFMPMQQQVSNNAMTARIKTMRLDMMCLAADPMLLTIRNPESGTTYPSQAIDVLSVLKQARNESGALLYKNQEDFDREDEFNIEIRLDADLYVRVFVENWEIINLRPGV